MAQHQTPSSRIQRLGFTRLARRDCKLDLSPKVNIVFVHGLRGHPRTTWEYHQPTDIPRKRSSLSWLFRRQDSTSSNGDLSFECGVFWPRDYLLQDIPEAAVWTYGYNADVITGFFQPNNQNSISHHGQDLFVKLERDINNNLPIIFVTHSLGGIVVKDAIHRSELCRSQTKLIVFLGTPHRGSSTSGWGLIASNLARLSLQDSNKQIIRALEPNSEVLDNIHDEFMKIAEKCRIKIHTFRETKAITGVKGLDGKIVEEYSAKIGSLLERVETIDANHIDMVKCEDKDDPRYRAIVGVLREFINHDVLKRRTTQQLCPAGHAHIEIPRDPDSGEKLDQIIPARVYHLPFTRNVRFTGRTAIIEQLKETLFINYSRSLAVVGLGGVGKTQLAMSLAFWVKDNWLDYSVFWVSALNHATFEEAYAEIARQADIRTKPGEDLKESVKRYLDSEIAGQWLLVIDKADDKDLIYGSPDKPDGILKYLPESEKGVVLFTTRSREVAQAVAGSDMIELSEMSVVEATEFLGESLINKELLDDKPMMDDLFRQISCLPLAIAQAAAYINQNQMSIRRYLELLQNTEQNLISLMSRQFRDNGRMNSVTTTWLESFDQISKYDKNAAEILSFLSCIKPEAIPQSILPRPQAEAEMEHAIGVLCGYSFLVRRSDDKMFDMHRLVHIAIKVWVQKQGMEKEAKTSAVKHLKSVFPSSELKNQSLWKEYMPHAQYALECSKAHHSNERFGLCELVGLCLSKDRRLKEAIIVLEETHEWYKQHVDEERFFRLTFEMSLGNAYLDNGQPNEAIKIFQHIVTVRKKTLVEEDSFLLGSQHQLGMAYLNNRQFNEAIEIFQHIVGVRRKTLTEENCCLLDSQHHLGTAYLNNRQLGDAIEIFKHIVAIRKKTLAENYHDRLSSEQELGTVYLEIGQVKDAIEILQHVVAVRRNSLAETNFDRLASEHWLAIAYLRNGQVKAAIEIFEHVVTIDNATGATRPDKIRCLARHQLEEARKRLENPSSPVSKAL